MESLFLKIIFLTGKKASDPKLFRQSASDACKLLLRPSYWTSVVTWILSTDALWWSVAFSVSSMESMDPIRETEMLPKNIASTLFWRSHLKLDRAETMTTIMSLWLTPTSIFQDGADHTPWVTTKCLKRQKAPGKGWKTSVGSFFSRSDSIS